MSKTIKGLVWPSLCILVALVAAMHASPSLATQVAVSSDVDDDYHATIAATDTVTITFDGWVNSLTVAVESADLLVTWVTTADGSGTGNEQKVKAGDQMNWNGLRIYGVILSGSGGSSVADVYYNRKRD